MVEQLDFNPFIFDISQAIKCPLESVQINWPTLKRALIAEGVVKAEAHIVALATVAIETAHKFEPIREYGGKAYFHKMYDIEGNRPKVAKALGNVFPGDGAKFCGRGFVQITGRGNYRKYGRKLNLPLETNPDLALDRVAAAKILASYFADHEIERYARWANTAPNEAERERAWRMTRRLVQGGNAGYPPFKAHINALLRLAQEQST